MLLGPSAPVVLCAVDWCGLRNDAHAAWCRALARAAHTTPERVAVQCVHPHNAPFADLQAEKLLESVPGAPRSLDRKFFARAVDRTAAALKDGLAKAVPFTHVGVGSARVEKVASNRRVLGPGGKVKYTRYSATKEPKVRAEPEGLIDPWLKTLSFWNDRSPVAALHYYATHPMSYYGDGRVSSDFCGLARQKRQDDDPKLFQAYFTEGRDIGDPAELAGLAEEAGLDRQQAAAYLASQAGKLEVAAEDRAVRDAGLSGVPTFVLDRHVLFSGAVPPDVFAEALAKARKVIAGRAA